MNRLWLRGKREALLYQESGNAWNGRRFLQAFFGNLLLMDNPVVNSPAPVFNFFSGGLFFLVLCCCDPMEAQTKTRPESQAEIVPGEIPELAPTDASNPLIPQYLLPLVHASETHGELGLTSQQVELLESNLREIDRKWWPARILPVLDQRKEVAALEKEMLDFVRAKFSPKVYSRLRQLEFQAQGPRSLLRPETGPELGLSAEKISEFAELAKKTELKSIELLKLQANLQPSDEVAAEVSKLKNEEIQFVSKVSETIEKAKFNKLYGKSFDTSRLTRIYPLAPELIDTGEWSGPTQKKIRELKGKVILVHFYAFECSNCRANFHRYNEWVEQFEGQPVEVIGIQTPETNNEFDPKKVRSAATRDGLKFPVLIDTKSENWKAWGNTMWPTVYVIDQKGYLRFWWQGELNWKGATGDQKIAELVKDLLLEEKSKK